MRDEMVVVVEYVHGWGGWGVCVGVGFMQGLPKMLKPYSLPRQAPCKSFSSSSLPPAAMPPPASLSRPKMPCPPCPLPLLPLPPPPTPSSGEKKQERLSVCSARVR